MARVGARRVWCSSMCEEAFWRRRVAVRRAWMWVGRREVMSGGWVGDVRAAWRWVRARVAG